MKLHMSVAATPLSIDTENHKVRSVISTSQVDRRGDVILPAGLSNAAEYLKNPVVLWAHQRNVPPIGTCTKLEILPDQIVAETQFSQATPLARDLFRLYAEGTLRGWSIGFVPKSARPRRRQREEPAGLFFDSWELLEYSAVPIPDNPQALTLAIQKGQIEDSHLIDYLRRDVLGGLLK
jgi:HK97 family phage prohead protease